MTRRQVVQVFGGERRRGRAGSVRRKGADESSCP